MTTPDSQLIDILGSTGSTDPAGTKVWSKSLPENLPILGLSDIVVFPGMVSPLLVETTQSIRLIDDVVAGDRFLGLILQRNPAIENPAPEDLWSYGCAARVLKMLKFPDNTVRVLVEGLRRFRVVEYTSSNPYLVAKIEKIKDVAEDSLEIKALSRNAERLFQEIIQLSPALSEQIKVAALNTEEPGKLADLIAGNLNLSLEERQHLLETPSTKERLTQLLPLLNRELEVLTLGSKIQNEVVSSMSKNQRDFFCANKSGPFNGNSAKAIRPIQRRWPCANSSTKMSCPKK
jgi:ATP-dependent Lon protease